jgi:hypothetical protein
MVVFLVEQVSNSEPWWRGDLLLIWIGALAAVAAAIFSWLTWKRRTSQVFWRKDWAVECETGSGQITVRGWITVASTVVSYALLEETCEVVIGGRTVQLASVSRNVGVYHKAIGPKLHFVSGTSDISREATSARIKARIRLADVTEKIEMERPIRWITRPHRLERPEGAI